MDINSIKTKIKQHKHITLKQKDNTSPIELILCGEDGRPLTSLSGTCTISLLDLNDRVVRSKINGQVNAGVVSFKVTDHLKANKHSIEIDVGGRKFPSDGEFIVQVSMSHDQVELSIIASQTANTVMDGLYNKIKGYMELNSQLFTGRDGEDGKSVTPDDVIPLLKNEIVQQVKSEYSLLSAPKQQDGEVIMARAGFNSLYDKISDTDKRIDIIDNYIEIEPESLRVSDSDTDGDLFKRALDKLIGQNKNKYSIKLGRIYEIDKTIQLTERVDLNLSSHIVIRGYGGGLVNKTGSYMFDGLSNTGGLLFDGVKFIGEANIWRPLFNGGSLIQLHFNKCNFINTNTVIYCDDGKYIQSVRFQNCNFKGMMNYQIDAPIAYDTTIINNFFEWGKGGVINLRETSDYCTYNLIIKDNVIEGISEQSPIIIGGSFRATISDNYFEGNNYTDIVANNSSLKHKSLTITKNFFGGYSLDRGKKCCVLTGNLNSGQSYDFGGNSGNSWGESSLNPIFDFAGSTNSRINMLSGVSTFANIAKSKINTGDGKYISSYGDLTSANDNSSVIASYNSIANGGLGGIGLVIASGNPSAGHSGGKSNEQGATVISSVNVENKNKYSVAGGYYEDVDSISSANRKWHIYSMTGNIEHSGTIRSGHAFADFAELMPNLTGESQENGLLQTLDGNGVRPAKDGEEIIGVTSATAGVILGDTPFSWQGRYLKDEFGAYIYKEIIDEETGEITKVPKENPEYNETYNHISRIDRPEEWSVIGLLGQVYVRVSNECKEGDYIKAYKDGVGTKSDVKTNIRVMRITSDYDQNKGYAVGFCLIK